MMNYRNGLKSLFKKKYIEPYLSLSQTFHSLNHVGPEHPLVFHTENIPCIFWDTRTQFLLLIPEQFQESGNQQERLWAGFPHSVSTESLPVLFQASRPNNAPVSGTSPSWTDYIVQDGRAEPRSYLSVHTTLREEVSSHSPSVIPTTTVVQSERRSWSMISTATYSLAPTCIPRPPGPGRKGA